MDALITIAILIAVLLVLVRRERKRFEREAARNAEWQARRDGDALDALMRDYRDLPHESYAWGPGADQPIPYLPAEVADFREWGDELARYHLEQLRLRWQEESER